MNLFCLLPHICVEWWAQFDSNGHNILFFSTGWAKHTSAGQPACKDTLHSCAHTQTRAYVTNNLFLLTFSPLCNLSLSSPHILSSLALKDSWVCVCVCCTVGTSSGGIEHFVIYTKAGGKTQPWAPDTTTHKNTPSHIHSPTVRHKAKKTEGEGETKLGR